MIASLELAQVRSIGPRKSALLVTKQLALEKRVGDARAVDGHERAILPMAVMIERAGDQFLARAALAGDQHGNVLLGDLANELEDRLHLAVAAHDLGLAADGRRQGSGVRIANRHDVTHEPRDGHGVGDDPLEFLGVERFEQVVVGPEFHRLDGGLGGPVGRHDDHGRLDMRSLDLDERFQPVEARHLIVEEYRVERLGGQSSERRAPVGARRDFIVQLDE